MTSVRGIASTENVVMSSNPCPPQPATKQIDRMLVRINLCIDSGVDENRFLTWSLFDLPGSVVAVMRRRLLYQTIAVPIPKWFAGKEGE